VCVCARARVTHSVEFPLVVRIAGTSLPPPPFIVQMFVTVVSHFHRLNVALSYLHLIILVAVLFGSLCSFSVIAVLICRLGDLVCVCVRVCRRALILEVP
jgi:hypothetical protein